MTVTELMSSKYRNFLKPATLAAIKPEMPNVINDSEIPKGFFYESDGGINYNFSFPDHEDIDKPDDTITLIGQAHDGNQYFYKLLNLEEEVVALLRVYKETFCGEDYFKIHKIGTKKEHRNKGYAKYLYNLALRCCKYPLVSDRNLTMPGSYNIWESLIVSRNQEPYTVSFINTDDCSKSEYDSRKHQTFYWGHDEDYLEEYRSDTENLELMYNDEILEEELYDYLKSNLNRLVDRKNIRFVLTYNGG